MNNAAPCIFVLPITLALVLILVFGNILTGTREKSSNRLNSRHGKKLVSNIKS